MGQSQSQSLSQSPSPPPPNRARHSFFGLPTRHPRLSDSDSAAASPSPSSVPPLPATSAHRRFQPLHSLLKHRHKRRARMTPSTPASPSPSSEDSYFHLDPAARPRPPHRRPSSHALLARTLSPARLSPASSPRYNTTTITTDNHSNSSKIHQPPPVVPIIDFQPHIPHSPPPIDEPSGSSSSPTDPAGLLLPPVLTHEPPPSPDLSESSPPSPSPPSPSPEPQPDSTMPEAPLTLDLSPQALASPPQSPSSAPPPITPGTASTPTRRIYVQGMVVARNITDSPTSIPTPSMIPTEHSSTPTPTTITESAPSSSTSSTSNVVPPSPSSVLMEQATMISRLLSVAAAATAHSLLPSTLNSDGTTITPNPIHPSPPQTSSPIRSESENGNETENDIHGGLQNTLRDALRAAFGTALMNADQAPSSSTSSSPSTSPEPLQAEPSRASGTTTGARIMHRLGLHHLLSNRPSPAPAPASVATPNEQILTGSASGNGGDSLAEQGSFERFLSDLQSDVGTAIVQALGGGGARNESGGGEEGSAGQVLESGTSLEPGVDQQQQQQQQLQQSVTFNFFRMHRFERSGSADNLVPVLLVGVRSAPPSPPSPPPQSPTTTPSIPEPVEVEYGGIREMFGENDGELVEDHQQQEVQQEGGGVVVEEEEEGVEQEGLAGSVAPTRSWLIFVLAGLYPPVHPIFTAPTLYLPGSTTTTNSSTGTRTTNTTTSPFSSSHGNVNLDYDTMLRLAELIGQVKPPTATALQIDQAKLKVLDSLSQVDGLRNQGCILENTAEKCLICLTEYAEEEEEMRLLRCKHLFHRHCIDEWLMSGSATCPACRDVAV